MLQIKSGDTGRLYDVVSSLFKNHNNIISLYYKGLYLCDCCGTAKLATIEEGIEKADIELDALLSEVAR